MMFNGWFISWAIPEAISPRVTIRSACSCLVSVFLRWDISRTIIIRDGAVPSGPWINVELSSPGKRVWFFFFMLISIFWISPSDIVLSIISLIVLFSSVLTKCEIFLPTTSLIVSAPNNSRPISEISIITPFGSINNIPSGEALSIVLYFSSLFLSSALTRVSSVAYFLSTTASRLIVCFWLKRSRNTLILLRRKLLSIGLKI